MDPITRRLLAAALLAFALAGPAGASESDSDGRLTIDPNGATAPEPGLPPGDSDSDGRTMIDPNG